MSEQQSIFDITELAHVSCQCKRCGTLILYSLSIDEHFGFPKECPTCLETMDKFSRVLRAYREFYKEAERAGHKIQLLTKQALVKKEQGNS